MKLASALVLSALVCLSLVGCGGGGGGGRAKPSTAPPVNSLSIAPLSLNVSADASISQTPTGDIKLSITSLPEGGLYVDENFAGSAIRDLQFSQTSTTTATLRVVFENPAVIGPGEYTGSVTVQVCEDQQCTRPLAGSPKTVAVRYSVTGVQPPRPALLVTPTSLNVETLAFDNSGPIAKIDFTLRDATTSRISVNATHSSTGLGSVYQSENRVNGGTFTVAFRLPSQLGSGVYSDVITLTASCGDCPAGVEGSPRTIAVQYTVSDTLAGPEGLTVRFVTLAANDLAWSGVHQKIYATVPSNSAAHGNSVAQINPVSATIETSSFAGSEPGILNASDDGQFLYVALGGANSIRRKALPSLQQDILIPIAPDPTFGSLFANDVQAAPGLPHTIAVARRTSSNFSGTAAGVVIYDDAVVRPSVAAPQGGGLALNWLQWGQNASLLYGNTSENTSFAVAHMSVDASGPTITSSQMNVGDAFNFGRLHLANGLLYADGGEIYDPATKSVVGRFVTPPGDWPRGVLPDPVHNKLFMVSDDYGGVALRSFNLSTFTPISTVRMSLRTRSNSHVRIVRWGTDGLAFATEDGRIVLIHGPFISHTAE
jgi:hypothetical protein